MTLTSTKYWKRLLPLFALLLVPALLVACNGGDEDDDADVPGVTIDETTDASGGDGNGGGGTEVSFEMVDIAYGQNEIQATVGEPLTINSENTGSLEHSFTIDEGPFSDVSTEGETGESEGDHAVDFFLDPGASGSVTFTTTEAGDYTFYCTIAGHREAGMEGTLTVSE